MAEDPKPNLDLLRRVLRQIDEHPETWSQGEYAVGTKCGTACCVAGWACLLGGRRLPDLGIGEASSELDDSDRIFDTATDLLGITEDEALDTFFGLNTRADIERFAEDIAARAGEPLWPEKVQP